MSDSLWCNIEQHISDSDTSFCSNKRSPVGGGSISSAWRIDGAGRSYFVKINNTDSEHFDMFAAEYAGLQALATTNAVRIPRPVCHGKVAKTAYLVCEWLNLARVSADSAEILGRQLAALHKHSAGQYGWHRDNTIGATLQVNTRNDDWCAFWRQRRLGFQLALAAANGFTASLQVKGERLMEKLDVFLGGHNPPVCLLHGDLWGGNWAADEQGAPVLFDPAVYFGDRETDLAMTELFGGFPEVFYTAYQEAWPLDDGYKMRKTLYNLYHILNHANLFGGAYAAQAEMMMDGLLAEAG
ncbi:MAG: fructosamine kinase family protein [Mariprofundaceae bacterium]|nr:fructosamine kinase family protein [Mariprofundaceae bacterium]